MLTHTNHALVRVRTMLICLAAVTSLLVVAAPDSARADARSGLSASATAQSGSTAVLTLTAKLRLGSGARLEKRLHRTGRWKLVQTLPPITQGTVRIRTGRLLVSTDFRVVTPRGQLGEIAPIRVQNLITLDGDPAVSAVTGERIRVHATVTPGLARTRVDLERAVGSGWRRVATATAGTDRQVEVSAIATVAGEQQYRLRVPATGARPEVTSDVIQVIVSAWYRLAALEATPETNPLTQLLTSGSRSLNGVSFEQSLGLTISAGTSATTSFELRSTCSEFRAVPGLSEDSDAGFVGKQVVLADDAVVAQDSVTRSSTEPVEASLDGADRLQLRSFALVGNGGADWGNPEVLCAGRP